MRLIDADALIDMLGISDTDIEIRELISDARTIDAVQVIRCKNCKHYDGYYCHNKWWGDGYGNYTPPIKTEDGFCDWADRKGDNYETNR